MDCGELPGCSLLHILHLELGPRQWDAGLMKGDYFGLVVFCFDDFGQPHSHIEAVLYVAVFMLLLAVPQPHLLRCPLRLPRSPWPKAQRAVGYGL